MNGRDIARFWSKVDRRGPDECWSWRGTIAEGYGVLDVAGRGRRAQRVAYELKVGPIPAGLVLDHLCRNRACVNPAHLEPVTNGVNVLRGVSFSAQNRRKTHCPEGHPLSGSNLHVNREGRRVCRECNRAACRRYYDRTERRAA